MRSAVGCARSEVNSKGKQPSIARGKMHKFKERSVLLVTKPVVRSEMQCQLKSTDRLDAP